VSKDNNAETQRRREDKTAMHENQVSGLIINAALEVHRAMGGPGLLESVYEEALAYELRMRSLMVERQKMIPLAYKGNLLSSGQKLDLLVEDKVIVECKATTEYYPIFDAQLLTYLRLTGIKLGLVINFGEKLLKNGIHRVVNGL